MGKRAFIHKHKLRHIALSILDSNFTMSAHHHTYIIPNAYKPHNIKSHRHAVVTLPPRRPMVFDST